MVTVVSLIFKIRAGKKNFLLGSTTWGQKFPADQRAESAESVLNLHVHDVLADHGFKFKE